MLEPMLVDGLTVRVARPIGAVRPPVLLVHGMFGGAWMWERWQRFLAARGWPSYALDLRGHHASRPVPDIGRVAVADYVEDARDVARVLGRPVVIGHSMGGLVAQKLAESGDVLAAVLLASAPPRWISPLSARLLWRMLFHSHALLLSRPIRATRADADTLMFNRTPPSDRREQFPRFVAESGRAGRELTVGTVSVDARSVTCPLLSVGAREDRFVVPRVARALGRKYGCESIEFANHAHHLIIEPGWEIPARAVTDWLEEVVGTTPDAA